MGWGDCGTDSKGRRIGYVWRGKCDHRGCKARINRGLSYACGGMHGENEGDCEGYFCEQHQFSVEDPDDRLHSPRLCEACKHSWNEYLVEDLLERIKENDAECQFSGWQSINTAPMDGSIILVGKAGCAVSLPAYWNEESKSFRKHGAGSRFDDGFDLTGEMKTPTHWMPMPAPPEEKTSKGPNTKEGI